MLIEDFIVEVLGISFNVNICYEEIKVFFEEGKVKFNFEIFSEEILMELGEFVIYF